MTFTDLYKECIEFFPQENFDIIKKSETDDYRPLIQSSILVIDKTDNDRKLIFIIKYISDRKNFKEILEGSSILSLVHSIKYVCFYDGDSFLLVDLNRYMIRTVAPDYYIISEFKEVELLQLWILDNIKLI